MKLLEQMLHETSNEAMLHLQKKVQFTHYILRPFYRHMMLYMRWRHFRASCGLWLHFVQGRDRTTIQNKTLRNVSTLSLGTVLWVQWRLSSCSYFYWPGGAVVMLSGCVDVNSSVTADGSGTVEPSQRHARWTASISTAWLSLLKSQWADLLCSSVALSVVWGGADHVIPIIYQP